MKKFMKNQKDTIIYSIIMGTLLGFVLAVICIVVCASIGTSKAYAVTYNESSAKSVEPTTQAVIQPTSLESTQQETTVSPTSSTVGVQAITDTNMASTKNITQETTTTSPVMTTATNQSVAVVYACYCTPYPDGFTYENCVAITGYQEINGCRYTTDKYHLTKDGIVSEVKRAADVYVVLMKVGE